MRLLSPENDKHNAGRYLDLLDSFIRNGIEVFVSFEVPHLIFSSLCGKCQNFSVNIIKLNEARPFETFTLKNGGPGLEVAMADLIQRNGAAMQTGKLILFKDRNSDNSAIGLVEKQAANHFILRNIHVTNISSQISVEHTTKTICTERKDEIATAGNLDDVHTTTIKNDTWLAIGRRGCLLMSIEAHLKLEGAEQLLREKKIRTEFVDTEFATVKAAEQGLAPVERSSSAAFRTLEGEGEGVVSGFEGGEGSIGISTFAGVAAWHSGGSGFGEGDVLHDGMDGGVVQGGEGD